jgi:hypothetical protein
MTTIDATSLKVTIAFKADAKPAIDPADPTFEIVLGTVRIGGQVTAKAARKLAAHPGGAVLQGKLIMQGGQLVLIDAGFTYIDPKPPATEPAS